MQTHWRGRSLWLHKFAPVSAIAPVTFINIPRNISRLVITNGFGISLVLISAMFVKNNAL